MVIHPEDNEELMDRLIVNAMKTWTTSKPVDPLVRSRMLARAASSRKESSSKRISQSLLATARSLFRDTNMDALEAARLLRVPGGVGYEYKRRSLFASHSIMGQNFLPISTMILIFS